MIYMIMVSSNLIVSSIMFIFLKHPLALGLALIWQTSLNCIIISLTSLSSWFSYILFLIFLGALLILFIYVAALASNETFKMSFKMLMILLITDFFSALMMMIMDNMSLSLMDNIEYSNIKIKMMINLIQPTLSKMYNMTSATLTVFIILFLLLTLIIVVKITSTKKGPLRKN